MVELIILTIICEAVWQSLKMVFQSEKHFTLDNVGSLVVSVLVCFSTNLDILKLVNINSSIPFLGIILTGILVSRGSSFIHDLLTKIGSSKVEEVKK